MSTLLGSRALEINITGLQREFFHEGKTLKVLRGIDVKLEPASMVSIRGRSGAGKSTFIHLLATLDKPTAGHIYFGDNDVFSLTPMQLSRFRNENIGLMFQFHHLLSEFTALENVMMPALIHRESRSTAKKRAEGLLSRVGLLNRGSHKPGELSGGEQQRVALARALMMSPSILLADEPTGNLDQKTGNGIHDLFEELNKSLGLTIVIVTHDEILARKMPRRLMMQDGYLCDVTEDEKNPIILSKSAPKNLFENNTSSSSNSETTPSSDNENKNIDDVSTQDGVSE